MGIGHVAVGLALKRVEPRANAGLFIFAALLSDFLLGLFVLAGMESYEAPSDYSARHYFTFSFPFSHGLLATILWTALVYTLVRIVLRSCPAFSKRAALVAAAAAGSHFVLDALVHVQGLPLLGKSSYKLGLGLWNSLGIELFIEAAMAAAALFVYRSASEQAAKRFNGMAVYVVLLAIVTIGGQAGSGAIPARSTLIASWIAMPPLIAAVAFWLDRGPAAGV